MSTQQNTDTNNIRFTQPQATQQNPTMDWTSEPLDMTSIRDDFRAFFGQTEEEWDAQMSTFPTYEQWVGQSGNGNAAPSMFPADDVQMANDSNAAAITTCIDPALLMDVANTFNIPTGSLGADYITPNVMPPSEYLVSDAVPGNPAPQQAPATTVTDPTDPTAVPESHKTTTSTDSPKRTDHETRIQSQLQELKDSLQDLELMQKEVRAELGYERLRTASYRNASRTRQIKQLQNLQQDEVTAAIKDLGAERKRGYLCSLKLIAARQERSWALARLVEVEEMNLKWQGKYEGMDFKWKKKYDAMDAKWQKKCEAAMGRIDRIQECVEGLSKELQQARARQGL